MVLHPFPNLRALPLAPRCVPPPQKTLGNLLGYVLKGDDSGGWILP